MVDYVGRVSGNEMKRYEEGLTGLYKRYKDMGDGTFAEIVALQASNPNPEQVVTDALSGPGQTDWLYLLDSGLQWFVLAGVVTSGPLVGTFVVEANLLEGEDQTPSAETHTLLTFTDFTELPLVGSLVGKWRVRARCSAWTSGTFKLSMSR